MTRKLKETHLPIPDEMAEAILNLPVSREGKDTITVKDLLREASEALDAANSTVQGSVLARMASELVMRESRKRGTPQLSLTLDGVATLCVTYASEEGSTTIVNGAGKLPSLEDLRSKAADMGVDISDLGRAKIKIIERLEAHAVGIL